MIPTTPTVTELGQLEAFLAYLRLGAIQSNYQKLARIAAESGQTHLEFLEALLEEGKRSVNTRR